MVVSKSNKQGNGNTKMKELQKLNSLENVTQESERLLV